jgi:hypothetical protein
MKKTHDIVATVGEWTEPETGRKVKRTLPIGAVFLSSKGNQVVKLDAVPVGSWSGWASLKPCAAPLPPGRRQPPGMPPAPTDGEDEPEDDMPF